MQNRRIIGTGIIRGWLSDINDVSNLGEDYFAMNLDYTDGTHPQFNGNISAMSWKSEKFQDFKEYQYTYDAANRLLTADYNISQRYDAAISNPVSADLQSVLMIPSTRADLQSLRSKKNPVRAGL